MNRLTEHFEKLDPDYDAPEEDVVASLHSVIGYALQTLRLNPQNADKLQKHLRSEYVRTKRC